MDSPSAVHTVATAATYSRRHPKTVLRALRRGELVGHQRSAGCSWRIYPQDLDAWIKGAQPAGRRRSA